MNLRLPLLCCIAAVLSIHCYAQDTVRNNDPKHYGKTIWCFTPLAFSETSKAVGISYERAIDHDGIFAISIPVMFGFGNYSNSSSNSSNSNSTVYGNFYAYPGVKIYPTGSFGKTKYSIGAHLTFATGDRSYDTYDPVYGYSYGTTQSFTKMGFIVNNTLNMNPLHHLYIGLSMGFGITYLNQIGGVNKGTTGLFLFSFNIGHRS